MGFLLSRRWLAFFVVIALAAWGAYALGQWQFHRLQEKRHANHVIAHNLTAAPVPVGELLSAGRPATSALEWRRVTIRGTWDDARTVVVKYQTNMNGAPGADVVTPLVTPGGRAAIVDRGWIPTENSGSVRPKTPPATKGTVTVTGWVRVNATGSATAISQMSTRAVSSAAISHVVPHPVYGGFVDLATQSPPPAHRLGATEMPDYTSDGPHFFYGLQWWFFGVLAVFGFFFLMYDEWQRHRRGDQGAGSAEPPRAQPTGAASSSRN
ncbi:MAG: SURF1 family cytochrome oxidase biogenesis protein [Marmoricola sp.]